MPETRITEWQDIGRLLKDMRRHVDATGDRVVTILDLDLKRSRLMGWRSVPANPEDGVEEWHCEIARMEEFLARTRTAAKEAKERRLRARFLGLLDWRRRHPPKRKSQWERLLDWVP